MRSRLFTLVKTNNYKKTTMYSLFRRSVIPLSRNIGLRALCTQGVDPGSKEHIESLVKNKQVVVFMKGTPEQPMCGFSNAVVQIMAFHGVDKYDSYNVLEDENLRQGIKTYSNWPTIPQVYMNGEFIGGCDIMLDMHKSGDLIEELGKVGIKSAVLDMEKNKE